MEFRSGHWLGHSKQSRHYLQATSWQILPYTSDYFRAESLVADQHQVFQLTARHFFMIRSTLTRFPGPFAERQPHIVLPPLWLTVGTAFLGLNTSFFAKLFFARFFFFFFCLAGQRIVDQKPVSLSKCVLAKDRRVFKCLDGSGGVFLVLYPLIRAWLFNVPCSVCVEIYVLELFRVYRIILGQW